MVDMLPRVYNLKMDRRIPCTAKYIGRGSKWGNPGLSIEDYESYLYSSGLIGDINELRGSELICFCKPRPCHGDVLVRLANDPC